MEQRGHRAPADTTATSGDARRRPRRAVLATVAVLAAVTLAACSSGSSRSSATSTTAPSGVSPITATAATDALRAKLADPGDGFTALPESADGAGPIDLNRAAQDSPSGQSAPLSRAGFVAGYQGRWQHTDGRQLLVTIYQFDDPAGAAALDAATVANPGYQQTPHFTVGTVPGAHGSANTGAGVASVSFAEGPYLVTITAFAPADPAAQALATQTAEAQYAKLTS